MKTGVARLFLVFAGAGALLFAFVTPPFRVPDEVGHFWRSASIAEGHVMPDVRPDGAFAGIPEGERTLVYVFSTDSSGQPSDKVTWDRYTTSWWLRPLSDPEVVSVRIPGAYTPIPYVPQIAAAFGARMAGSRAIIAFVAGRVFNALAFVLLVALAIRSIPVMKIGVGAAAMLPMSLFLAGSWSPDAMTTAVAFLFTALLVRAAMSRTAMTGREAAVLCFVAAVGGSCKPAYFLIGLLVFAIPRQRFRTVAHKVALAVAIGAVSAASVAVSMNNARATYTGRPDKPVDPAAQLRCVVDDPLRFAGVAARTFAHDDHVQQLVGRFGMLDVPLAMPLIWGELALLAAAALMGGGPVPRAVRVWASIGFAGTVGGIVLSSYLGWTPPCADVVEGLQGRYFLPVVPLVMLVVTWPAIRPRPALMFGLSFAGAISGLATLIFHYWAR